MYVQDIASVCTFTVGTDLTVCDMSDLTVSDMSDLTVCDMSDLTVCDMFCFSLYYHQLQIIQSMEYILIYYGFGFFFKLEMKQIFSCPVIIVETLENITDMITVLKR